MQLRDYQKQALSTDQRKSWRLSVFGLVGEVGSIVSTYKKRLRDGEGFTAFKKELKEEIGDALWYIASVASNMGFDLEEIARENIAKNKMRWQEGQIQRFDKEYDEDEQFPRKFNVLFREKMVGKNVYVKLRSNGIYIGDRLTDNAYGDDSYRYHDAFHLAYVAILGWSPVLRAIMKLKRKSKPKIDEVEDGARAQIIEEAIALHVFSYASDHKLFEKVDVVGGDVLEIVRGLSRELEVKSCTGKQWERAILEGYRVFRELVKNKGGLISVDMDKMNISYSKLP